jgi:hypothetical protein
LLSPLRGFHDFVASFTAGLRPQLRAAAASRLKSRIDLKISTKIIVTFVKRAAHKSIGDSLSAFVQTV